MNRAFRSSRDLYPELATLQQHLEQLFQATASADIRGRAVRNEFPAINVGTAPDSVEVVAFVPGVDRAALQISIDRGLLIIAGERNTTSDQGEQDNVYAHERFAGSFRRVISLPEDADPTRVEASLRDGVLHISIEKRESSKPRQIDVQ